MVKTGIPTNFYTIVPKVVALALLLGFIMDNTLLAVGLGVFIGTIVHIATSYYDCMIYLKNGRITFYFIRPFFFKEEHNLCVLDNVEILRESKYKTLKDMWWQHDSLLPLGYDMMLLHRKENTYKVRFRTNEQDLPSLEAAVKEKVRSKAGIEEIDNS